MVATTGLDKMPNVFGILPALFFWRDNYEKADSNLHSFFTGYLCGSALVMSIYSIVDSVCVGQYHQEAGTAALAVIMPLLRIKFRPCLKQIPLFRQIMKQRGIFFIA